MKKKVVVAIIVLLVIGILGSLAQRIMETDSGNTFVPLIIVGVPVIAGAIVFKMIRDKKALEEQNKECQNTIFNLQAQLNGKAVAAENQCEQIMRKCDDAIKGKFAEAEKLVQKKFDEAEKAANKKIAEAENAAKEKIAEAEKTAQKFEKYVEGAKETLADLNSRIDKANSELIISETETFFDPNITSEEYKNKRTVLETERKEFVKSGEAVVVFSDNEDKKKRTSENVRQILRCFNSEAVAIINKVTAANIDAMRGKLQKAFEEINTIFKIDGVALSKKLLEMWLEDMTLFYSYKKKEAIEQEEQKAIREQMREEEKVRLEIEREKAKIEKEENQFKNEVNKLMQYLAKSSEIEKQLYVDKINELNEKLKLLEKDKENVLEREQNTRAGYVYIISNIGSFGENIYKIGMTRRLEPMDRVRELGDASVPFEFDVHAMIFSEDAPALETILHNTFKDNRVNLVNPRKEFYNVSLSEIEKVVKENYNATVTFTQIAEAAQYRESLRLKSAS